MGTALERALSVNQLAELKAPSFGMEGLVLDGTDFFNCYAGFKYARDRVVATQRPILIEAVAERFRGHSISDPALYRSKEHLQKLEAHDPIMIFKDKLVKLRLLTEEQFESIDREEREKVLEAMKFAEQSPWPNSATLETGVYAP
jgi:pyruvate dehydrogenase E1 component alpha subunit